MRLRAACLLCCAWCGIGTGLAQERIANLREGTNMALTLAPGGDTLVVDLIGQLWELPITGGAARPLTPPEQQARNPRFSPDGMSVVYQRFFAGQWDLWLLDRATGEPRQLSGPPFDEREPDFSQDGNAVVFASDRGGSFAIWELDLRSGSLGQLTAGPGNAYYPSVSERGEIAYVTELGGRWSLDVLGRGGESTRVLTDRDPLRAPSWRPGGGVLLFNERGGADGSGLNMVLLSATPVVKPLTRGEDVFGFRAAWTSPGEFLYTADGQIWRRGLASTERRSVQLFAGVAVRRVSEAVRAADFLGEGPHPVRGIRAPAVAPAGELFSFTALGDLWLQRSDAPPLRLTDDVYLDIDPTFSPDAAFLVFASDRAGALELWRLDLASRRLDQLTFSSAKSYAPAISPDGRRVAYLRTEGFGPWSPATLELLQLDAPEQSRTVFRDLTEARNLRWDDDGMGVSLIARSVSGSRPDAPGAGRLHVSLSDGSSFWTDSDARSEKRQEPAVAAELDWVRPPRTDRYVILVDRLFDGIRNRYQRHMDIHIEDGRISAVVARGTRPLPEIVVDARDHTILPGLIDLHAHHSALAGERLGRVWLAYGVTTVREVSQESDDGWERKEAWSSGKRLGPHLLLSSPQSNMDPGWSLGRPSFDVLELYAGRPEQLTSPLIREAATLGLPVFSQELFPAARFGISGLEHIGARTTGEYDLERSGLNVSYQDVLSILTETGAVVTPSLAAFGGFSRLVAARAVWSRDAAYSAFFAPYERARWNAVAADAERVAPLQRTIARLLRSGGRVAAGSDAPTVPYGLGLHAELALLSEAGIPNDQILRLVTAEAALALGLERYVGTVEAGKVADLVVLRGNPLARISDSLRIEAVVKDGVWLERERLVAGP
jgi:Tol biopolymer transport system component